MSFPTKEALKQHLTSPTHISGHIRCQICGVTFPNHRGLTKHHMECVHISPALLPRIRFCCLPCAQNFNSQPELDRHLHSTDHRDPSIPVFLCSWCKDSSDPDFLEQDHVQFHEGLNEPLRSPPVPRADQHCSLVYGPAPRYQYGYRDPPVCTICSSVYFLMYPLDPPPAREEETDPYVVYQCQECPRRFHKQDMMTLHAANHIIERLTR